MEECRFCTAPCRDCGYDPHDPICSVCGEIHITPPVLPPVRFGNAGIGDPREARQAREHEMVMTTICKRCGRRYSVHLSRAPGAPGSMPRAVSGIYPPPSQGRTP